MDTAKASSEAAVRRDAMLEALAFAAQRFLEQPSWVQSIDEILGRLGEAVGVSRAYVFENRTGEPPKTVLRSFWLAPGVASSFQVGDELGFEDLERWVETLSHGEVVGGPLRGLPPSERRRLEPHGIRSVLLVPVVVSGTWWGYIGFDDCVDEREWPQVEIDVLLAAGGTLAAAIDRERAEAKLREAEATYRSIVESTPAITYQEHVSKGYDVGGSVLYVSPQVERILGYSARDWAETPGFWEGIVHPDDHEAVLEESERTGRSGEPYRQEYRMIASDGRVVWFRDECVLIRDERGEPQMWQGVMVDITEAKLAEARLREAEEQFRALVEHLPAVTYREALVATPEDFYISPRVTEVFGYSPEEWTWTPRFWSERLHPDDRERVLDGRPGNQPDGDALRRGVPVPQGRWNLPLDPRRVHARPPARRLGLLAGVHARHHRTQGGGEPPRRDRAAVPPARRTQPAPDLRPGDRSGHGRIGDDVPFPRQRGTHRLHRRGGAGRPRPVDAADPPGRPRTGAWGRSGHQRQRRRLLARVPDAPSGRPDGLGAGRRDADRVRGPRLLAGLHAGHHRTQGGRGEGRAGPHRRTRRDAATPGRRRDEEHLPAGGLARPPDPARRDPRPRDHARTRRHRPRVGGDPRARVPDRRERPQARPAGHRPVGSRPPRARHRRAQAAPDGGERAGRAGGRRNGPGRRGSGEPGPAAGDRERRRREGRTDRREPARERVALHAGGFDGVGPGPARGRGRDDRRRRRGARDRRRGCAKPCSNPSVRGRAPPNTPRASGSGSRSWPGSPSSWADAPGSTRALRGVRRSASIWPTALGPPPRSGPRGRAQPNVAAPRARVSRRRARRRPPDGPRCSGRPGRLRPATRCR